MALLTTQQITQSGLTPSLQAASSGGDTWLPTATTFLLVENASGSSETLTITVTAEAFGQPVQNVTVTVPANTTRLLGPYPPGEVAGATGAGSITYSSVTSLTIAAISI